MRVFNRTNLLIGAFTLSGLGLFAQGLQPDMQNYRLPGYDGLNVFETKKDTETKFEGLKVRVGGDFALQFQGIGHTNEWNNDSLSGVPQLKELGGNLNLPTANLNLDVQLADGMRMHLRTYLSSRHHPEAWVKGGYIQMDNLNFVKDGLLENFMSYTNIRIGLDEINYGDAHFRRTDNASALYNPFVGNYIMDAFTTEAFGEITLMPNDWVFVAGISNGKLNQSPVKGAYDYTPSFYGKVGWDSQINEDTRLRITGSFYTNGNYNRGYLYGGDRAGSRYYEVMNTADGTVDNDFSGRFNPGFTKFTSFQVNPFVKWKGLEFFGVFEMNMGDLNDDETAINDKKLTQGGSYTQIGAEVLYRFGSWDQFYVGGRFNSVSGNDSEYAKDQSIAKNISRINVGAGWFMTKNVVAKLEYVTQDYSGDGYQGTNFQAGNFNGIMFEAAISF